MSAPPPLGQVCTLSAVARFLGCTVGDLRKIASEDDQRRFYKRLRIPKRNRRRRGQFRTVYKANQKLTLIQKKYCDVAARTVKAEYHERVKRVSQAIMNDAERLSAFI